MLHFAGGIAFGVDVGDLLELERAFEGDGEMDAAAEVEEIARSGEALGELLALGELDRCRTSSILPGMRLSSSTSCNGSLVC